MQTKQIKELKNQASALGRHLRDLHGLDLPHSALLETLAAMHNAPDWNALQARPAPAPKKADTDPLKDLSAQQLLAAAMAKGLKSGEAINAFAQAQSPYEKAFAEHARDNCARDGELEFDNPGCLVSLSSDRGAYVMGWYWVPASEVALKTESLADLLDNGFELISVLHEGEDADTLHYQVTGEEVTGADGKPAYRVTSAADAAQFEAFEVPRAHDGEVEDHDLEDDEDFDEAALKAAHPFSFGRDGQHDVDDDEAEERELYQVRFGDWCLRFKRVHSC